MSDNARRLHEAAESKLKLTERFSCKPLIIGGQQMIGKRKFENDEGQLILAEGDYGKQGDVWFGRPFGSHMGSFENHDVVEHEDGTITVSPSILIDDGESKWHGYLEKGVWREC